MLRRIHRVAACSIALVIALGIAVPAGAKKKKEEPHKQPPLEYQNFLKAILCQ